MVYVYVQAIILAACEIPPLSVITTQYTPSSSNTNDIFAGVVNFSGSEEQIKRQMMQALANSLNINRDSIEIRINNS